MATYLGRSASTAVGGYQYGVGAVSLTQNVPIPTTNIAGDLLLLVLGGNAGAGSATFSVPGGWTLLADVTTPTRVTTLTPGDERMAIYYRIADGTEGPVAVTGGSAFNAVALSAGGFSQWYGEVYHYTDIPTGVSIRGLVSAGSTAPGGFTPTVPAYVAGGYGTVVQIASGYSSIGVSAANGYTARVSDLITSSRAINALRVDDKQTLNATETGATLSGNSHATVVQFGIVADPDLEAGQASTATECGTTAPPVVAENVYFTGNWPRAIGAGDLYRPLWGPPTPDCQVGVVQIDYLHNEPTTSGSVRFQRADAISGGTLNIAAIPAVGTLSSGPGTTGLPSQVTHGFLDSGWAYVTEALTWQNGGSSFGHIMWHQNTDPSDTLAAGFDVRVRCRPETIADNDSQGLWSLGSGTSPGSGRDFHSFALTRNPAGTRQGVFRVTNSANVATNLVIPGFADLYLTPGRYTWIRCSWDATSKQMRVYTSTDGSSWTLRASRTTTITALRSKTSVPTSANWFGVGHANATAGAGFVGQISDADYYSAAGVLLSTLDVATDTYIQGRKNRFGFASAQASESWSNSFGTLWQVSGAFFSNAVSLLPCGTPGANPGVMSSTYTFSVPVLWEELEIFVSGRGAVQSVSITPFCGGAVAKSSVGILMS